MIFFFKDGGVHRSLHQKTTLRDQIYSRIIILYEKYNIQKNQWIFIEILYQWRSKFAVCPLGSEMGKLTILLDYEGRNYFYFLRTESNQCMYEWVCARRRFTKRFARELFAGVGRSVGGDTSDDPLGKEGILYYIWWQR